jgi:hypothetical protein
MDNEVSVYENEFRPVEVPIDSGTLMAAESIKEVAQVQAAVMMAKKFPRDRFTAFKNIIEDCGRYTLAKAAVYSFPRGGSTVAGPSIRLAEVLARNWGNIDFGVRELSRDKDRSVCEAYAWDLETNTRSTRIFEVPHERKAAGRIVKLTDPRDIYENVANQGSRRLRACILQSIPGDVTDKAVDACKKTVTQKSGKPLVDRLQDMVVAFGAFGITAAHIEKKYGHELRIISEDELFELITIYNSLKDSHSKRSDFFDISDAEPTQKTLALKEKLTGKAPDLPDPSSEEGKRLSAELDQRAAG